VTGLSHWSAKIEAVVTGDVLGRPAAEVSVRPARPGDVPVIGDVHARSWRAAWSGRLPGPVLEALRPEELAAGWEPAVTRPPDRRHLVLVACDGPTVVGFAAAAPHPDGPAPTGEPHGEGWTGELVALHVDPAHQRRGHASRLLQAVVDLLAADGARRLVTWCPVADAPRRALMTSAGLAPDGAGRDLDVPGGHALREERLAAALDPPGPDR
jgi:GNAT superfamily N-acetyltransferase